MNFLKILLLIIEGYFNLFISKLNMLSKEKRKIYQDRLSICLNCKYLDKSVNICERCGCFVKAKTKANDADCPMELW